MKELLNLIKTTFAKVPYPGDSNLRNNYEGDEPFLLEEQFSGKEDWRTLPTKLIDQAPNGFASGCVSSPERLFDSTSWQT
jgi:hypothetical protein